MPPPPPRDELPSGSVACANGPPPLPPLRSFSPTPTPNLLNTSEGGGSNVSAPEGSTRTENDAGGDGTDKGAGEKAMDVDDREKTPAELEGLGYASPLQRQVMALSPGSRALRINRLGRLSSWEFTWETNMARNKEGLASYQLEGEVATLMEELRNGTKRKLEEEGGGKSKRPRADGVEGEDEYVGGSDGASDDNDGERGGTPTLRGARGGGRSRGGGAKGKAKKAGRGCQTAVGDDNVPKWATDAHITLLAGGGGDVWVNTMELWWRYEKAASFAGPVSAKAGYIME
ncbi:hypothetical protein B0H16DRAFT_1454362 [Mycena metata]|uniref:Uncharacterized protein n=1 Tax=Mycena metata TaxID=1033252 RepID=A0AAD7JHW6_9AGAR|nr:hypothetical protein B0H16DRAFT_1454362 [Mycena metata]